MTSAAALVLGAALLVGCVTTTNKPTQRRDPAKFRCGNRQATFVRTSNGVEDGVVLSCVGAAPFIQRWVTRLEPSYRRASSHSLTPAQFSFLWMSVGSTGWYRLQVCKDSADRSKPITGAPEPATTVFRITQGRSGIRLECRGKHWPRPLAQLYKILTRAGKRYAPWAGARMPR